MAKKIKAKVKETKKDKNVISQKESHEYLCTLITLSSESLDTAHKMLDTLTKGYEVKKGMIKKRVNLS